MFQLHPNLAIRQALLFGLLTLAGGAAPTLAQKVKSTTFNYIPEQGPDRYDMRVPRKTLALADGSGFVILAHQSAGGYAVERYDADLKKQWSTTIPVAPGESLEAFGRGPQQALGGAAPQRRKQPEPECGAGEPSEWPEGPHQIGDSSSRPATAARAYPSRPMAPGCWRSATSPGSSR